MGLPLGCPVISVMVPELLMVPKLLMVVNSSRFLPLPMNQLLTLQMNQLVRWTRVKSIEW